MTPDKDYIIDEHPTCDNIVIGAGFSGENNIMFVECYNWYVLNVTTFANFLPVFPLNKTIFLRIRDHAV